MLKVTGTIGAAMIASVLIAVVAGWPAMITLGIFHSYFHSVPPLGFWVTSISALAVRIVIPMGGKSSDT